MEHKKCYKCGLVKPIGDFYKNKSCKDGLSTYCKSCFKDVQNKYRETHSEQVCERRKQYCAVNAERLREYSRNKYYADIEKERERQRVRQKEHTREVHNLKTPCVKCGENRNYVIDFHHIDPSQKKYNISQIVKNPTQLAEEISKCVCLCRNCHSEYHWFYGANPKEPVKSLTDYIGCDPYSVVSGGVI
jgi:hypothetical protein